MDEFRRLILEIHHRSLWQVLAIYLAGSWIALQVVDTLDQTLSLPDWAPGLALVLLVVGLPFVLATAFVHEGPGEARRVEAQGVEPVEERIDTDVRADGNPGRSMKPAHPLFRKRNVIGGGITALVLWGILSAGWIFFGPGAGGKGDNAGDLAVAGAPNTIAVLPFANISGTDDAEPFTVGIHDDILTQLTKIGALQVTSRTSVLEYRDSPKPIGEIADELGVRAVLEGGVQSSGGRVRINVQLIDPETDRHLWAETYDRELTAENVFEIQSEIALSVAEALRAELAPEEQAAVVEVPTRDLEALALYHRGRELFFDRMDPQSAAEAISVLEAAVERDPEFAAAWAELAKARSWLLGFGWEDKAGIEEALSRASLLSPGSFETEMGQGYYDYYGRGDFSTALERFDAAARLRPTDVDAILARALIYRRLARWDESVALFEQAVVLDPRITRPLELLAGTLGMMRRYDEALQQYARAVEVDPNDVLLVSEYVELAITADDTALAAGLVRAYRLEERPEAVEATTALAYARKDYEAALRLEKQIPVSQVPMHEAVRLASLGYAHLLAGDEIVTRAYADTLEAVARGLPDMRFSGFRELFLGMALMGHGRDEEARDAFTACVASADPQIDAVEAVSLATVCLSALADVGAPDEAIDGLIRLAEYPNRELSVGLLKHAPGFRDNLGDHPRFPELMAKLEAIERAAAAAQ